jgi:cell division protein FtsI (penicillin-binding protein 3)
MSVANRALEWRTRFLVVLVCGCWLALAGRLVQLQCLSRQQFAEQVEHQSTFLEEVAARPGDIFDRDGRLLATSIAAKSFFVIPSQLTLHPEQWQIVRRIADAAGLDADPLQANIAQHAEKHFLWVRRRMVDADMIARLDAIKLPRDFGGFREEFLRQYPQGHLAAHVLGGRDIDGVGRGGVEQHLNDWLAGQSGFRRLVLDSRRKVIEMQTDIDEAPEHGQSVTLSLDTVIQLHAEEELDKVMSQWRAKHAAAIVMDPKTGEILAMASRPTYDPNELLQVSEEAWKNQALAAIFEPGSTFKPFIVSWGLEQGLIGRDESFDCEHGEYRMGRRVLHDHHKYGVLNVTDVLVKSSNIGMAKIGERLSNAELHKATTIFGFGRRCGIELPGELVGLVRPLKQWTSYSTGSVPMGQEIAVTPLQLIAGHAALANGGRLISPRLVRDQPAAPTGRPWAKRPESHERSAARKPWLHNISLAIPTLASNRPDESDESNDEAARTSPAVVSETVHSDIARWMVESVMTEVVRRGTGRKAKLDDYTVFGKTGTAQKRDPQTGKYSNRLHTSSFVGGAPAANPRVMVLVMVDEPSTSGEHFGGEIAAPPARTILHKALIQLGVPPEQKPAKNAAVKWDRSILR